MVTATITMPALHPGQDMIRRHPARFKVVACGRRWGKTRLGLLLCLETALQGKRAWWVAPTYKLAGVGWRGLWGLCRQIPGVKINKSERLITFPSGGTAQVQSADDPDSLRSEGLDRVIVDECAYMKEEAWTASLRPALSDRIGDAFFISTPKGRNWLWRNYQKGISGDNPSWGSWQYPTSNNPYIDPAEIEAARLDMPEALFRQEYLAEFIEDAGLVFRNIMRQIARPPAGAGPLMVAYVMGVDWAQQNDWTVALVMDAATRQVVAIDRFNQIDYKTQRDRIASLAETWGVGHILAETNAMGQPNVEALQEAGLPVEGFTTTAQSKPRIIQQLQLAFEQGNVWILDNPVLIGELQAYEQERRASGWKYEAPAGMHDDTVIALALAYEAAIMGSSWSFRWV